jgi:hypothetical protein
LAGVVLFWLVYLGYGASVLLGWLPILFGFYQLKQLAQAEGMVAFRSSLKGAALVVVGYSALVSLGLFLSF